LIFLPFFHNLLFNIKVRFEEHFIFDLLAFDDLEAIH
jgi:hypothetical protein